MTHASMTPGSRPRRGVIGVLALLGAGALTAALVVAAGEATTPGRVAGAVALDTFASCDELAAWGSEASGGRDDQELSVDAMSGADADAGAVAGEAAPAPRATDDASDGAMNGASEGAATTVAEVAEGVDDETNVAVEGVDEIDLVDRLTEDVVLVTSAGRLAVVDLAAAEVVAATDVPWDAQITYDAEAGVAWVVGQGDTGGVVVERYAVSVDDLAVEGAWTTTGGLVDARRVGGELHVVATDGFAAGPEAVPFAGGPVPCDEVLHPVAPSDPTATLLVTLPATGAVEPVRATEVVGSGSQVHVTDDAVFLATADWSGPAVAAGIHRFDAATLEPTGSGVVDGTLLDEFSMSEHDGVLRVAVTEQSFGMASDAAVNPVTDIAPAEPDGEGAILNEIVVLDTEGTLDVVGRTERFGHPGETLHGIRFAGTTAYAVTFLQTDPFYVVDLTDPAAPAVVGEVELPGFSSYLHPLDDGSVVGFGPGADGRIAAKLFDVSDPTEPVVADELVLGDDSAIAWDHHAYLDLGDGRFAVPAATYAPLPVDPEPGDIEPSGPSADWGVAPDGVGQVTSSVVVVDATGGELAEEARHDASTVETATRVLTVGDGWALLAGPQIVVLDAAGDLSATISL